MSTNSNKKNGTTARQAAPKATARSEATHDNIRGRAYELYCERRVRDEGGDHVSDWLLAEQELNGHAHSEPIAGRSSERHEPHDPSETELQTHGERLVHA